MNQYQHDQDIIQPNMGPVRPPVNLPNPNQQNSGQPVNHSWNSQQSMMMQQQPMTNAAPIQRTTSQNNYPNSPSINQFQANNNPETPSPGFLDPNRVNLPGHIGSPMNPPHQSNSNNNNNNNNPSQIQQNEQALKEKAEKDAKFLQAQADQKIFLNKTRFETELEFVQCLANPQYVHFLAQRGYFKQEKIINYINYLDYWRRPEYCRHLRYPQCLAMLELLKYNSFREAISNQACAKFIEDQMILQWQFYNRKRDRIMAKAVTESREKLKNLQRKVDSETQEQDKKDGMKK